jgi:flagellar hook-length control protein FliK
MNLQRGRKNNCILEWMMTLTMINNKNIANDLNIMQSAYKSAMSDISSGVEANFKNVLNSQLQFKPDHNESISANTNTSPPDQTKPSEKNLDKSANTDNKKIGKKHEKIEKSTNDKNTNETMQQKTTRSDTPSIDVEKNQSSATINNLPNNITTDIEALNNLTSTNLITEMADKNLALLNVPTPLGVIGAPAPPFSLTTNSSNTISGSVTSTPELESPIQAIATANMLTTSTVLAASAPSGNSLNSANWQQEVTQKIIWMTNSENQSATIILNSLELGPLKIVIHVTAAQAEANFTSNNPQLRQALEDGMSSLREMMKQSGIELGQTNINSGNGRNGEALYQYDQYESSTRSNMNNNAISIDQNNSNALTIKTSNNLVNTYA